MSSRWIDDDDVLNCLKCSVEFSPLVRRHHCRRCGGIFCDDCSSCSMLVPPNQFASPTDKIFPIDPHDIHRVCDSCAVILLPLQDELQNTWAKSAQEVSIERESMVRYMNVPISFSLEDEIQKATYSLINFTSDNVVEGADSFPSELIAEAAGIAFITIVKAGFFFSGSVGSGCVIGRLPDNSWSAPAAICVTSFGWGFQMGGEVTDVLVFLNSKSALDAFCGTAQLSIGTEMSVSLGPVGRMASADIGIGDGGISSSVSYAHSKGLYFGISLQAGVIFSRPDVNESFYGAAISTRDILTGKIPAPKAANSLYTALQEVMTMETYTFAAFEKEEQQEEHQQNDNPDDFNLFSNIFTPSPDSDEWAAERQTRLSTVSDNRFGSAKELSVMQPNTLTVSIDTKNDFGYDQNYESNVESDSDGEISFQSKYGK